MALITVFLTLTGEAWVRSPFEARDLIKGMPVRRWDKVEKVWVIPASDVPALRSVLEQCGYRVAVTRAEEERSAPSSRRSGDTWADRMFIELPPPLADKCFKALSRALHPDVGGDTAHMQVLTAARDRHRRLA